MSVETVGVLVIIAVFILMFLRVPIVLSMAIPAFVAILYLKNSTALYSAIESVIWEQSYNYTLSTIPLFVLMGQLLFVSGFSDELFQTFRNWFGRLKGGLAMATIGASAVFASSSGSSLATTSTIGLVSSKEMLKSGYSKVLTGGSIVAGGTLGILIPPSTMFIIYGMITEQSIGKLLIAGIVPGILLTLFFILTIYVIILINPKLGASKEEATVSWKEKFSSIKTNIWIICLFILVMGGIYIGWFTATEAAGFGALGAFIIALLRRKLTRASLSEAVFGTIKTTGFIFAIVMGAFLLNYVLTITRVPNLLADFLFASHLSPFVFFLLIVLMYLVLGAIMDTMAMVVVTVPILMPTLAVYNFDLIWFGVIIVLLVEVALISPPVGMNCFVLRGVVKELDLGSIFKGAIIFVIPILSLIFLLYFFPDIAIFLPNAVK
ncbi:TRAP transporter large permease [Psychrobacillus sp. NPDC096426]|uniref:TRAP transporter large permease n=1 Tax=Psychrobacillus sp. NPDC096426 TaxID=3364491 RepID=UPI00381D67D1